MAHQPSFEGGSWTPVPVVNFFVSRCRPGSSRKARCQLRRPTAPTAETPPQPASLRRVDMVTVSSSRPDSSRTSQTSPCYLLSRVSSKTRCCTWQGDTLRLCLHLLRPLHHHMNRPRTCICSLSKNLMCCMHLFVLFVPSDTPIPPRRQLHYRTNNIQSKCRLLHPTPQTSGWCRCSPPRQDTGGHLARINQQRSATTAKQSNRAHQISLFFFVIAASLQQSSMLPLLHHSNAFAAIAFAPAPRQKHKQEDESQSSSSTSYLDVQTGVLSGIMLVLIARATPSTAGAPSSMTRRSRVRLSRREVVKKNVVIVKQ